VQKKSLNAEDLLCPNEQLYKTGDHRGRPHHVVHNHGMQLQWERARPSQKMTHLAVISFPVALRIVRPLAMVVAPPARARMVANSGREGVTRPTCCRVPLPVTNSTCMQQTRLHT